MKEKIPIINLLLILFVSCLIINISILRSFSINTNTSGSFLDSSNPDVTISSVPPYTEFVWGEENATLTWEVQGGDSWSLWRNGTFIRSGEKISDIIEIKIENWQLEKWRLAYYNLTLMVRESISSSVNSSVLIKINFEIGDEYANSVVRSSSSNYDSGDDAIGAPNKKNASIFFDYDNGILVLDMGVNEEITNGIGNDFEIIAEGGNYTVKGGNELGTPFTFIGQYQGNGSFDISSTGLEIIRYIHIQYSSGDVVEVDAIKAINYNIPLGDLNAPIITGPSDFWIWENQTYVFLTWSIIDLTPWNYSITVNGTLVQSGPWNGSDISLNYTWSSPGNISITIKLYDLFENFASDNVLVEIKIIESDDIENVIFGFSVNLMLGIAIVTVICVISIHKKLHRNHKV